MANNGSVSLLISPDGTSIALKRIPLSGADSTAAYKENQLQQLLYWHPEALPVDEIDSAYEQLVPICTEMSADRAGYIDIMYATASGGIVILEAKLWRNPEARRKVVGQILDYATELSKWSYSTLDARIKAARRKEVEAGEPDSLFAVVSKRSKELDEAKFTDAVQRNLRRGEFLLLIVGDGIREGVGEIANFLERHGTLQFTFGLVEMAVFRMPDGSQLLQPRVLARTTIIQRIVVDVRGDGIASVETDAAGEDDPAETPVDAELTKTRELFQSFWGEFLGILKLDYAGQEVSAPARTTNQFFYLPRGSKGWVSAYVAQSLGFCGVYITFERGPLAEQIYASFLVDRDTIEKDIGSPLIWENVYGKCSVAIRRPYSGRILVDHRKEAQEWLADYVNRFVTVFRPRVEAFLRETGAG